MGVNEFDRRAIPAEATVGSWTTPDGHKLRTFDWPAPAGARPRGTMLFQGGRGDVFEKYLESFAHWQALGWRITSFDWRGQGGSGRLTERPHVGHIEDFAHYIADIGAFWAEWTDSAPGPRVAVGHSMGGHLLLRAMIEGVVAPDAAVLVAPMLGLKAPINAAFGERLARLLGGVGKRSRPAWRGNEKPYTTETRQNLLTHDRDRYADELWWQQFDRSLLTGPPSWQWVIEAFASTRQMRLSPELARMTVPTLLLIAEADELVDARAALAIAARLPEAKVVRFGAESAHEILREVDRVRNRALAEIDLFLAARAPGGA